jgi:hypothetical protein
MRISIKINPEYDKQVPKLSEQEYNNLLLQSNREYEAVILEITPKFYAT